MTWVTLGVLAGGVLVVAIVWIALTRRSSDSGQSAVLWLRPIGRRIVHAFRVSDLIAELPDVDAIGHCGRWSRTELVMQDGTPRCAACVRAVEQIERRQ